MANTHEIRIAGNTFHKVNWIQDKLSKKLKVVPIIEHKIEGFVLRFVSIQKLSSEP